MTKIALLATTLLLAAVPAKAMDKTEAALKIVAMGAFVKDSCVGMEPNMTMISAAVNHLVPDLDVLKTRPRLIQAGIIINAFSQNVSGTCRELKGMFGPNGSEIPGLIDAE